MTAYFVTGTDTGAGKTTIALALLEAARAKGLFAAAVKPAESGCIERDGVLVAADAERLGAACCYRLRDPVAPNVAARRDGVEIELSTILGVVDGSRTADLLLVEGAGGLLVPLTDCLDMAGLAAALELPLLIVARDSLGTINHTVLTAQMAQSRGLVVAGVILSATQAGTEAAAQNNEQEIRRILGDSVPFLGRLPYAPEASAAELGRLALKHIDVDVLTVPRGTITEPTL